jgi:hypothetical protein
VLKTETISKFDDMSLIGRSWTEARRHQDLPGIAKAKTPLLKRREQRA